MDAARDRDDAVALVFGAVSIAFLDTTTLWFEGAGGESLGQYGHSKAWCTLLALPIQSTLSFGPAQFTLCSVAAGSHRGSGRRPRRANHRSDKAIWAAICLGLSRAWVLYQ